MAPTECSNVTLILIANFTSNKKLVAKPLSQCLLEGAHNLFTTQSHMTQNVFVQLSSIPASFFPVPICPPTYTHYWSVWVSLCELCAKLATLYGLIMFLIWRKVRHNGRERLFVWTGNVLYGWPPFNWFCSIFQSLYIVFRGSYGVVFYFFTNQQTK